MTSSKRPFRYNGNSIRTRKRRKAIARKMAMQNGCTITHFFSSMSKPTKDADRNPHAECDDGYSSTGTNMNNNMNIVSLDEESESASESNESYDNNIKTMEVTRFIETQLKDDSLLPQQRWRLEAVLQYLRLLLFNKRKMESSLYVSRQLDKNLYFARQLRSWARALANRQEIPSSMRGKHIKVNSLLDDEDVRYEIVKYLRTNKFEFYVSDFMNYVSDVVFPKLGIEHSIRIGY